MVSSHAGSDSGHREGTATTRCREEEIQQDALMLACANPCSGHRVVLAHSLLTMGHSTRRAEGFDEIFPLRNQRLGLRASFLSAVCCTMIITTDQHRRDPFRFRGVLHRDAIQFASTCALKFACWAGTRLIFGRGGSDPHCLDFWCMWVAVLR